MLHKFPAGVGAHPIMSGRRNTATNCYICGRLHRYRDGRCETCRYEDDLADDLSNAFSSLSVRSATIHFSYKQNRGRGGNNKVTMTKTHLTEDGHYVHMRNGQIANEDWWTEWKGFALSSDLVVCFVNDDYWRSSACNKEYEFCRQNGLPYCLVETNQTAAQMYQLIRREL
jgi:hypothetical protein